MKSLLSECVMLAAVILLFHCSSSFASGVDDEEYVYDDLNYDDEEVDYINPETNANLGDYNPKLLTKKKSIEVDAGTTIRLPCVITQLPVQMYSSVMWAKLNKRNTLIATGDKILTPEYVKRGKVSVDQSGSTLIIAVAQDQDAGKYKCSLTLPDAVQEVEHTVFVRGEPLIQSNTPAKLSLSLGDEMTLSCKTSGPSSTNVRWTKKEGNLHNGLPMAETDVLSVKSVSANHSGTYLCTAKDSTGRSAEKMVEVVVSYPPQVSVTEVVIHAISGDVAELICKVTGEPSPKVAWSKEGTLMKKDKRIGIHNENTKHYLTIKQIKEEDLGMYTCSAKNTQGMAHRDITLTANSELLNGVVSCRPFSSATCLLLSILATKVLNLYA